MRRRSPVAIAAIALCLAASATHAAALAPARLPPDLRRLLTAEQHLRLRGFLVSQSVVQVRAGSAVVVSRLVERGRLAPARYAITSSVAGRPVFLRYIGAYAYGTAPGLARLDGGHRWVRVRLRNLAGGRANVLGLIHSYLTDLSQVILPPAAAVLELGPTTVGGQPVTEFLATATQPPVSATHIFLAADGLPVRTVETVGSQITTTDTSVTLPVLVKVPPPGETIDEQRLLPAQQQRVNNVLAAPPGLQ